jgi:3',5'-cyclic AMP phosphodiesterase CpdA
MTTLLHVSDTHFGTERAHVAHDLLRLARELRPDLLVVSGDITQRARARQFTAARAFVDALGAPHSLVIPGNHDIPLFDLAARIGWPYRGYIRAFGDALEPAHESDELLVLCLNNTRPARHKHGEVSREQVERVAQRLRRAGRAQLRIVVTHQPCAVPRADARRDLLRGGEHALAAWSDAGADLVLGGHIHLPCVIPVEGLARPLWVALAGTAVSRRVRPEAGNSVNVIRWYAAALRVEVERWDFVESAPGASAGPALRDGEGWALRSSVAAEVSRER